MRLKNSQNSEGMWMSATTLSTDFFPPLIAFYISEPHLYRHATKQLFPRVVCVQGARPTNKGAAHRASLAACSCSHLVHFFICSHLLPTRLWSGYLLLPFISHYHLFQSILFSFVVPPNSGTSYWAPSLHFFTFILHNTPFPLPFSYCSLSLNK